MRDKVKVAKYQKGYQETHKMQLVEYAKSYRQTHKANHRKYYNDHKIGIIVDMPAPIIGEIRKGCTIGKNYSANYIWRPCIDCGVPKWVVLDKGEPHSLRCRECAAIESRNRLEVKIKHSGKNNHNWRGGTSFEPYAQEFNKQFKYLIRTRDSFTCQLCGVPEREYLKTLPIHHIDYDKKNSLPTNLITLCGSCNTKVNNNRGYWTIYFRELLNQKQLHSNQLGHKLKKYLKIPTLAEYVGEIK